MVKKLLRDRPSGIILSGIEARRLQENKNRPSLLFDHGGLVLAGALLSLMILIPWARGDFPFHPFRGESLTQGIPFRLFMLNSYREGLFPVWNPYIFGGMPFWAYSHSMCAYPVMLLSLLPPLLAGVSLFYLFHIWLLCWGAYRLLQVMKFPPWLSLLGTILISGSSAALWNHSFDITLASLSWFPALIYIGIRLLQTGRFRYFLGLVVMFGCQFATGEIEGSVYSTATVYLFTLLVWPGTREAFRSGRGFSFLAAPALAMLLAALAWVPLWEYLPHSVRSQGVTLELYRLFPSLLTWDLGLIVLLFSPPASPFCWPVLFFAGHHLLVKRKWSSWALFGLVLVGYFYFYRVSRSVDEFLFHLPLVKTFLRRDQVSGGIIFFIHWLGLLGMKDLLEDCSSGKARRTLFILCAVGTVIAAFTFSWARYAVLLLPFLAYLPGLAIGLGSRAKPLRSSLAVIILAGLILTSHYPYNLLGIESTPADRITSDPFQAVSARLDPAYRYVLVTNLGHSDPELIPQQGMIFDRPELWGWNRVPPRKFMELMSLVDPKKVRFENGRLANMEFVFQHLDGSLLTWPSLPLLDLMSLKYCLVKNLPVKVASPYYLSQMINLLEYVKKRRVDDQWRDLMVTDRPLRVELVARSGQVLRFSLVWDAADPPAPSASAPVIVRVSLDEQLLLDQEVALDLSRGGPGESPPIWVELEPADGRARALLIEVTDPEGVRLDRFRFRRPRIEDPSAPFQLIASNGFDVFENREVLPPAFLLEEVQLLPSPDAMIDQLKHASRSELATTALLLDTPAARELQSFLAAPGLRLSGPGRIARISDRPGRRVWSVDTPRPSILFVSQNRMPGWRAIVNGKEEPLFDVDWAFCGLRLGVGSNRVELLYQPPAFRVALWASLASLAFLLALAASRLTRPRTTSETRSPRTAPPRPSPGTPGE